MTSHASHIRVLLVDDHAMVRQGLRSVLESYADVDVVGEAADGEAAIADAERFRPSVVIMDINMPRMNGIEATARIKARFPETVIIGLSVNAGGSQEAMIAAGASALLTKEAAVDELYHSIQTVLSGGNGRHDTVTAAHHDGRGLSESRSSGGSVCKES